MEPADGFMQILAAWKTAALVSAEAEATYRKAHAAAYVASAAKTEAQRKAEADVATDELRQHRDLAAIEEQAARYLVDHAQRRTAPERAA